MIDEFGVEHRYYTKGFAICLAEAVASIIFLHFLIAFVLQPISEHSFFIKAIEKLY
jgi:hypothetical protein